MKEKIKDANYKEIGSFETTCINCGGDLVIKDYQRNLLICEKCGQILQDKIKDRGPEWRAYDQKGIETKSRAGPPTTETIHDRGLSTQIDWKNRDAKGNKLSSKRRSKMYRLRKWHKQTSISSSTDRNLTLALTELNRMASQLNLSRNIQEITARIYRRAVKEGYVRGRSIEGVISAAIYAACRIAEMPRTLDEIAEASGLDKKKISRNYRFINRELTLSPPIPNPVRYIAKFGSSLELSGETQVKAIEIVRKAQNKAIGKSPLGTAAAALYIAGIENGEKKTQKEIAEAAKITEVTLRNRYKSIVKILEK